MKQRSIDKHAAQTFDAKPLDETHAAHVRRQIVHFDSAFTGALAIFVIAQVEVQAFSSRHALIPFGERFFVDATNIGEAFVGEIAGERAADEAAAAADNNQIAFREFRIFFNQLLFLHRAKESIAATGS